MKKSNKFKAAVIGCGRIGAEISYYHKQVQPATHAGAYQANKKIKLVALVDRDEKKLRRLSRYFPEAKLYTDIGKMLREERPEIVSVATPTEYHYEHVLQAAQHQCPVILCEKPIAYKLAEAQKMIEVCKKQGSQLFINYQRRFDFLLKRWRERTKKLLARVFQGQGYYCNGLFNNGSHLIDLLRMFLGEPVAVTGYYNKATSSSRGDLNIDGLIIFRNDLKVSLHSLSKNYDYFNLTLFGEKGRLDITDLGFQMRYQKKIRSRKYKGSFELSEEIFKEGKPRSMQRQVVDHLVSFLAGKAEAVSSGEQGLICLQILSALKQSAEAGGRLIRIKA